MNFAFPVPPEVEAFARAMPKRPGMHLQAVHEYTHADGMPWWWIARWKCPETGEKAPLPFHRTEDGFVRTMPKIPHGARPLYRLHNLARYPTDLVYVVEGEGCADCLEALGFIATTWPNGSQAVASADWSPLAGRRVVLWPDNDKPGLDAMEAIRRTLEGLGALVVVLDVERLGLPPKGDCLDWLRAFVARYGKAKVHEVQDGHRLAAQEIEAIQVQGMEGCRMNAAEALGKMEEEHISESESPHQTPQCGLPGEPPNLRTEGEQEEVSEGSGGGQSSQLVAFVLEHADLLRNGDRDVFTRDRTTREVRKVGSESFGDWLSSGFYREHRRAARRQALTEACSVLVGTGRESGEQSEVHVRTAYHEGAYFLDLGEEGKGRSVRVVAGNWCVEEAPPVHFLRPRSMRPIAPPIHGGSLSPLWEIANVPEEFRVPVVAWLCECLRPETPFPILEMTGEEGSAKSTTQRALRTLIDPNASLVDAPPKSEEDLLLSAADALVCSIENVSHLTPAIQDAFCRLATGAGMKRRKLYSDAEVVTLTFKRPVVLNGITEVVTASDMVNRTMTVDLPRLTGGHQEEAGLWARFEEQLDGMRGALLDVFADALRRIPGLSLPKIDDDRMASFMRLGMAVAEAMGKDGNAFLDPYLRTRQEAGTRILEGNPVGAAVLSWIERYPHGGTFTPKEWMDKFKPDSGGDSTWPRSPKGLAMAFKRLAPALRRQEVECCSVASLGCGRSSRGNQWRIARI